MNIVAFFTSSGVPATGISPTIRVRNVSTGALVVTDQAMTETGDGFYSYDFSGYDALLDYAIRCDGTATLPAAERYTYAGNESYFDDIAESTWTAQLSAYPGTNAASAIVDLGYSNQVCVDVNSPYSGTGFGVGTSEMAVNNIGDAITIADSRGIHELVLHSSIVVDADDNIGHKAIVTVGTMGISVTLTAGCSADGAMFRNLDLSGTLSNGDTILVNDCSMGSFVGFTGIMNVVAFLDGAEITFGPWASLIDCAAGGSGGNEPELTMDGSDVAIHKYTGNIKFMGKTGTNTVVADFVGGNVNIDSTCVSGSIQLLGTGALDADDSGPNCNVDTEGFITVANVAYGVWEEMVDDHGSAGSTGRKLKDLASSVIYTGTAAGSGVGGNQIEFAAGASSTDGAYDPALVSIIGGLGVGQTRGIYEYNGSTRTATIDRNWKQQPDITSEIIITAWAGREHVNEGLAQGGTASTITLNTLASDDDDVYVGQTVFIRSGTGEDQAATVLSYVGSSKIATISPDWRVIPDTTSGYVMLPQRYLTADQTAHAVWDDTLSEHLSAGSAGLALSSSIFMGAVYMDTSVATGGDGTPGNPTDTLANAVTIANVYGFKKIFFRGAITLSGDFRGWTFEGRTGFLDTIILNNQQTLGAVFICAGISGVANGGFVSLECVFNGTTSNLIIQARDSLFEPGTYTFGNFESVLKDCASNVPGTDTPIFDLNGVAGLNCRAYSGGVDLRGCTTASQNVSLDFVSGRAFLHSSNTDGTIVVRGPAILDDQSNGSTVVDGTTALEVDMKRALGLMHENIFIDTPSYDGDNNLVSARVRIYSDSASVGTANNVIGTYTISSVGAGAGKFTQWAQVSV